MATAGTVTSIACRVCHTSVGAAVCCVVEVEWLAGKHQSAAEMTASPVRVWQESLAYPLICVSILHQANQMSGT